MFKAHSDDDFLRSMKIAPGLAPEIKANQVPDLDNYAGYRIAQQHGWNFYEFVLEHGWVLDIEVMHSRETHNTVCTFNNRPVYGSWPDPGSGTVPFVLTRAGWKRIDQLSCPEVLLCCAADSPARAPKITEVPEKKYTPEVRKPHGPNYPLMLAVAACVLGWVWLVAKVIG